MTLADFLSQHLELFATLFTVAAFSAIFAYHWIKGATVREQLADINAHLKYQDDYLLSIAKSTPGPYGLSREPRSFHGNYHGWEPKKP